MLVDDLFIVYVKSKTGKGGFLLFKRSVTFTPRLMGNASDVTGDNAYVCIEFTAVYKRASDVKCKHSCV